VDLTSRQWSRDLSSSIRRLFGLPAAQGRWLMILLGITTMLCLGTE
jgi:hypothetical protein